jgi:hypothetical protein
MAPASSSSSASASSTSTISTTGPLPTGLSIWDIDFPDSEPEEYNYDYAPSDTDTLSNSDSDADTDSDISIAHDEVLELRADAGLDDWEAEYEDDEEEGGDDEAPDHDQPLADLFPAPPPSPAQPQALLRLPIPLNTTTIPILYLFLIFLTITTLQLLSALYTFSHWFALSILETPLYDALAANLGILFYLGVPVLVGVFWVRVVCFVGRRVWNFWRWVLLGPERSFDMPDSDEEDEVLE